MARSLRGDRSAEDRPGRAWLAAAFLFGMLLVAAGLYLWRRPPAPETATSAVVVAAAADAGASPAVVDAGSPSPVTLSDVRVLGCHDRGPTKTPADQCDHLAPIEQALSRAIEQSAPCLPPSGADENIQYVADVSFSRHNLRITLPRAGRSVKDRKVVGACATAVRSAMQAVPLDGVDHRHSLYKLSVVATYKK
jgi:hypothetical protein